MAHSLEVALKTELQNARGSTGSKTRDLAEIIVVDIAVRTSERRAVEGVEGLNLELPTVPISNHELFHERHVEIYIRLSPSTRKISRSVAVAKCRYVLKDALFSQVLTVGCAKVGSPIS